MHPELDELCSLLRAAARAELLPRFRRIDAQRKADGSVVTEADLAMQQRLRRVLAERWPQYRLLGEEMGEAEQRALLAEPGAGLWCLDPLDGTSNFAAGVPLFAVSLALLINGAARLGAVYDPVRDECFSAVRGQGAWLNGEPLGGQRPQGTLGGAVALVDFKRLAPALARRLIAEPPYHSQRNIGVVALDWCWLAAGRGQLYLHGGQKLWDYAAGSLILAEAGGSAVTLDGEPVFASTLAPRSVAAALDAELFGAWTDWLQVGRGR